MKEYIERAAAINAIRQYQYPYGVEFLLANLPTADVAEVRHGRWIDVRGESSGLNWKCSLCAKRVLQKSPCCPNCGARMDKEDEHEVSE